MAEINEAMFEVDTYSIRDSVRVVYNVVETLDLSPRFVRVGTAIVCRDGSLDVMLDTMPLNGRLHIRSPRAEDIEAVTAEVSR